MKLGVNVLRSCLFFAVFISHKKFGNIIVLCKVRSAGRNYTHACLCTDFVHIQKF